MKNQILFQLAMANGDLDPSGVYGMLLHYAMTILLVGGAFIIFLYLWRKGRLDMDENPKIQMMLPDEERQQERGRNEKR